MRSIDKYLRTAIEHIENKGDSGFWKGDKIPKVYKGYIASFGTIIKQSGAFPAVVLFSQDSDRAEASKKPITKAIFKLLKENSDIDTTGFEELLRLARENQSSAIFRKELLNAAVALKLALRTFNIEK
ncbi:MAG: hypothetical protein KDD43_06710 [Bdellovibrionales bacterium]|nr:hypothetical protein [Bdellovibrionales bacterium]